MTQMLGQAVAPPELAVEPPISWKLEKPDLRGYQAVVPLVWVMVLSKHNLPSGSTTKLGDGIAWCRQWYHPYPEISGI